MFEQLVELFRNHTPIPGNDELPGVRPMLDDYSFPGEILDETRLRVALEPARVERIRQSLKDINRPDSMIRYEVPWYRTDVLQRECVDMIYSQAVLEHVNDLRGTYRAMRLWLKPTGYVSHQIDFNCHGTANEWNGHWAYSDFVWRLIRGNRPFLINRVPHSRHVELLGDEGFNIVCDKLVLSDSRYKAVDLAPKFRSMLCKDLTTSGAFIQAIRTQEPP